MSNLKDLMGQQFGRLTAVSISQQRQRDTRGRSLVMWHCRCQCGGEKDFRARALTRGEATSCGCIRREKAETSYERQIKRQKQWISNNPEKVKEYRVRTKENHPETARRATATYRARRRAQLDQEKIGKPCVDCHGLFPPECLDFDHLYGKKFQIGQSHCGYSWETVVEEIAKCELVCANCHRIRTKLRHSKKYDKDRSVTKIVSPCCI